MIQHPRGLFLPTLEVDLVNAISTNNFANKLCIILRITQLITILLKILTFFFLYLHQLFGTCKHIIKKIYTKQNHVGINYYVRFQKIKLTTTYSQIIEQIGIITHIQYGNSVNDVMLMMMEYNYQTDER